VVQVVVGQGYVGGLDTDLGSVAIPMSADANAGASLMPSPTMPTM
jgi:hypothetical protein